MDTKRIEEQEIIIKIYIFTLLLAVLSFSVNVAFSEEIRGRVVGVAAGDTITILAGTDQYKVRLYGIDCPEKGQDFGMAAKKLTSALTFNKTVKADIIDIDRYGRNVGIVFVGEINVNEKILRSGFA